MRSVSTIISVHFDSNVVEKEVNLKQTAYSVAYMYILYILPMFIRQLYKQKKLSTSQDHVTLRPHGRVMIPALEEVNTYQDVHVQGLAPPLHCASGILKL